MSRSTRVPIDKVGAKGNQKKALERQGRRATKNAMRTQDPNEDLVIPDTRSIVDGRDYVETKNPAKNSRK